MAGSSKRVARRQRVMAELAVEPGSNADIAGRDPAWGEAPTSRTSPRMS